MKKNNKTNKSVKKTTAALVFDRFYGARTNAAAVILGRVLIAAAITFFSISYIFLMYEMPVNKTALPFIAAGASVVFSLLFTAVKKRIAIPILALISGVVILSSFNSFWRKFSFFIDALILECDGRLFQTTGSTIHPLEIIEFNGRYTYAYVDGAVFGSVILCMLFALITAAGIMGKPHILPSLVSFLLLWIPKLTSERLYFSWQLIPLIALYAGVIAIGSYYREGLAIRHVYAAGGYRRKVAMDDRRFNAAVRSQNVGQRVVSRGLHYSKYFSSVMSAAAIFTALGLVLSVVFEDSTGIDYAPLYEKLQSIEGGFGSGGSPFKTGAAADYFTSPSNSIFKSNNRLRLTSPSTGTKEIIRVTKPISDKPLYLRGDIGIDFDGTSWSSPVTEEPEDWRGSGLDKNWLPIEIIALANIRDDYFDLGFDGMGTYMDTGVEYLCDTDVIFAPAYDAQYRLFDPKYEQWDKYSVKADIFGDFAARRKTDTAAGETLKYLSAVPNYTDASNDLDVSYFGAACYVYYRFIANDTYDFDNILTDTNGSFDRGYDQRDYNEYINYVKAHYLGVPESMKTQLDEFIKGSGLNEERSDIKKKYTNLFGAYGFETNVLTDRFFSAAAVSEYLKSNYTYSLDARIDRRNPVMSFLNNTKSGHCALYASAMTLILREWGIPARYCTGFAANANLSMQTLRSKDLHAWCEVYLDELGWVTFDPTASAVFDGQGGTSTSTTESGGAGTSQSGAQSGTENSSQGISSDVQSGSVSSAPESSRDDVSSSPSSASDSTQTSGTHESTVSSEPDNSFTFVQILPYLLIMLAICAVIALIVLIVMAYIRLRKCAYKQIQQFHREKNSDYVYEKLLAVLRFCKLKPMNGEQPHEFFERAEKTLGCSLCDNYELFEKLAFGRNDLDESERALLGRAMDKIYRAAENRYKFIGKIKLRLLVLSKKV